ncbi:glycoside hydrolase TIM-barrel-like domain-containing protein [Candidatus Lariskella endosymbiont of Epinotia ramella]|uniref:baseplate megatron protein TIM-barrel domain-containing protein n=1 Tax=Candidatus Lariskella endosymbiont of Epinotia ramella TaxID=3066224 RepID=UPI0030CF3680
MRREIDRNSGGKFSSNIKYKEPTYTVSMAIALCSGKIQKIERIWADDLLLNQNNYNIRFYLGTEDQMPDPMIESLEGIGKTPAYRGLSYVVFDHIDLGEFGNKIPNFTFEVSRNIEKAEEIVEDMIESVVIIPGSGEFIYDTQIQNKMQGSKNSGIWVPHGYISPVNQHNNSSHSNSILSLNQLKQTLPNIQWVAPVVNWFATSLNIADSKILPGVEFHDSGMISPDEWEVAGFKRKNALLVPSEDNKPIYGGTPNDLGVIRYLEEMKKRGYKIMLYPMPLVAEKGKPWRGRMYGNASEVQRFFTKKGGYNEFILHYAKLAKGKIDAFLIGSELVSITKIADQHNNFPAVDELVNLASMVRKILGNGVKISYAADWSEYHHTDGGWYHLDKLWASYDIDFIGIDAYFPITDSDQSEYDPKEIKRGWDMGEGYDFYFSDENRNIKKPLTPQYAWKNIEWWWENPHIDPNGKQTNWIPKSKKIWFTEYGFPSVDCASNQPNMFFDSKSNESRFPKYSKGNVDIMAQRVGIQGTEERWKNSRCVERKFLWCWDARPYPFWPSLRSVWDDVDCWSRGHWIQGKVAKTLLSDVLGFLCSKAGLTKDDYDTSRIHSYVDGLYISARTSIRKIIEILQSIYFFDAVEKEGKIHFIPRYSNKPIQIKESELIIKAESNAQDASLYQRLCKL